MKILLILAFTLIIGCSPQKENTDLTASSPATEPVQTTPEYVWVYDPEPWSPTPDTEKPNLLSIGDSISVGYITALSREMSEYDVKHPDDNCRNSFYTLANVDSWLNEFQDNSIIIWNNGVWDSTTEYWYETNKDFVQAPREWYGTSLANYESNLIQIARKLKATGARVVFLTTTEIKSPPFEPLKELLLNEIAKRVLPAEGVEVFDLHKLSTEIPNSRPNQWDVHFTREANVIFAQKIAEFLKK